MKKDAMIFGGVTLVAMITAAVGHAVNPAFCVAVKPLSWPFVTLAVLLAMRAVRAHRKGK